MSVNLASVTAAKSATTHTARTHAAVSMVTFWTMMVSPVQVSTSFIDASERIYYERGKKNWMKE